MANTYTLGYLFSEVEIARKRVNRRIADEAHIMHDGILAILGGKKAHDGFNKTLKEMRDG